MAIEDMDDKMDIEKPLSVVGSNEKRDEAELANKLCTYTMTQVIYYLI